MVRAPCCEKMGLKKGPWTQEEDHVLINYIQKYGHGNWRALPKQAGLLRCGKSCRLRWTNYLRPDIKRGNFTKEEEDTIISLHEKLGNRWSAIAARLPGRTDNEIKNVWHTYLKKRLQPTPPGQETKRKIKSNPKAKNNSSSNTVVSRSAQDSPSIAAASSSPLLSCSTDSSSSCTMNTDELIDYTSLELPEIDETIWKETLSIEENWSIADNPMTTADQPLVDSSSSSVEDDMDFWRILMEYASVPNLLAI